LSLPIIAGSAVENITSIVNTAFLGHLSPVALGASAIAGIFYLALIMLGFGFGIGVQIIIARRYGEQNHLAIGEIIYQSAFFLLTFGVTVQLVFYFFGHNFFKSIIKSEEIYLSILAFLNYRIWGLFFAYINIIFRAFYTGILRTRIVGYYSVILASFNILFDYLLIFGNFGFPKMGIAGAGLSSVIAEIVSTVFFVVYTSYQNSYKLFGLNRLVGFDIHQLTKILKIASPVMIQFTISFGGWFVFFMMIEKMGEIPLAVSNVVRTFYLVALLPLWGYAAVTNTLVSNKIGANQIDEIKWIVLKILKLSFLSILLLVLLLNIFSQQYFSIFTNNSIVVKESIPVVIVVSISSILMSVSIILFNIISGSGKTTVNLIIEFILMASYILWTYLNVYIWHSSIVSVWVAEIIYSLEMGIFALFYLKYGDWKTSKV